MQAVVALRILEPTVAVHPQPVVLELPAVLMMAIYLLVAVVVYLVLELEDPQELVDLMLVVWVELQVLARPSAEETMASTTQSVDPRSAVVGVVVEPVSAAPPERAPLVEPEQTESSLSGMPGQTETHPSRRLAR